MGRRERIMIGTWGRLWAVVVWVGASAISPANAQESARRGGEAQIDSVASPVRVLQSKWIDVAAHLSGARGSVWRTDLVLLNRTSSEASVELLLHLGDWTRRLHTTVPASSSKELQDVVGLLGHVGKGALEVRSNQPLTVHGRTYSVSESGTFGQFVDSHASEDGLVVGEVGWLSGLRQIEDQYRSNVCITNTGSDVAAVHVSLFTAGGFWLMTFPVFIQPGEAHLELEPFWKRRARNDISCGCVRIEVVAGSGILASASMIDEGTNDAITVPMRR
jgi:hypothetical protein